MALKTYVGARYAPRFMGAWNKSNEYAALSVVYHDNQSYVSRKTVPAETEITNTEYWIRSSDWNAQVDEYRNQVDAYDEKVVQYNQNVEAYNTSVNNFFEETIHAYNTKEDMVNDESIKLGYTLITCGETSIGDGSGAFYQAVSETSSGAVALKNGLFAKKFQLMPERFNRYTIKPPAYDVEQLDLIPGDEITLGGSGIFDAYDRDGKTVHFSCCIHSAVYLGTVSTVSSSDNNLQFKFNADSDKLFYITNCTNFTRGYYVSNLTILPSNYGVNICPDPTLGRVTVTINKYGSYFLLLPALGASIDLSVKTPNSKPKTFNFRASAEPRIIKLLSDINTDDIKEPTIPAPVGLAIGGGTTNDLGTPTQNIDIKDPAGFLLRQNIRENVTDLNINVTLSNDYHIITTSTSKMLCSFILPINATDSKYSLRCTLNAKNDGATLAQASVSLNYTSKAGLSLLMVYFTISNTGYGVNIDQLA